MTQSASATAASCFSEMSFSGSGTETEFKVTTKSNLSDFSENELEMSLNSSETPTNYRNQTTNEGFPPDDNSWNETLLTEYKTGSMAGDRRAFLAPRFSGWWIQATMLQLLPRKEGKRDENVTDTKEDVE